MCSFRCQSRFSVVAHKTSDKVDNFFSNQYNGAFDVRIDGGIPCCQCAYVAEFKAFVCLISMQDVAYGSFKH